MRGPEADSPTEACWVADGIAYTLGLCGLLLIGLTALSLLELTARTARGVARSPEWTVLHELTIAARSIGEGAVLIVPAVGLRRRRAWGWYTAIAVCMLALVVLVWEIRTILGGPPEPGGMYALMGMGFWAVLAVAALGGLLWAPTRRCLGVARRG